MTLLFGSVISFYYLCTQPKQIAMKKTLSFLVTIEFDEAITSNKCITDVATNVAEAIVDATNGQGIAPSDETFTTHVEVTPMNVEGLNVTIRRTI